MKTPEYEALDGQGRPLVRLAQCIGELPEPGERARALERATVEMSKVLNSAAVRRIGFGIPVHVAFGLTRQTARKHAQAKLLLLKGDEVPLMYCGYFEGG